MEAAEQEIGVGRADLPVRRGRPSGSTTRTQLNARFSAPACSGAGYARHFYAVRTTDQLLRSHCSG